MNWQNLIQDLQARGLTITNIAQACGCGQATITDLKLKPERNPSYTLGERLVALSKASDAAIKKIVVAHELDRIEKKMAAKTKGRE